MLVKELIGVEWSLPWTGRTTKEATNLDKNRPCDTDAKSICTKRDSEDGHCTICISDQIPLSWHLWPLWLSLNNQNLATMLLFRLTLTSRLYLISILAAPNPLLLFRYSQEVRVIEIPLALPVKSMQRRKMSWMVGLTSFSGLLFSTFIFILMLPEK